MTYRMFSIARPMSRLALAGILFAAFGTAARPTAALGCTSDAECDDGLFCNGSETCPAADCVAGTPVDCSGSEDQCNDAACTEAEQGCVVTPKIDGFGCDDGDACTLNDVCQAGECVVNIDGDADNDGYCDAWEDAAGCNPGDFAEIPPQANVYSGGLSFTKGEALLTFNAPNQRKIDPTTDPSCAMAGVCNSGFCTAGKIGDPCATDGDCNQPTHTCRIIVNYGDSTDLTVLYAHYKLRGFAASDMSASLLPATPGCSRKIDVALPLTPYRRAKVRLKAAGTVSGKIRRDIDVIRYQEPVAP